MVSNIEKTGSTLILTLEGHLDAINAPEVEEAYKANSEGLEEIVLEMEKVGYVASAFLRVVLTMVKSLGQGGRLVTKHTSEAVKDIFSMTGFDSFIVVE